METISVANAWGTALDTLTDKLEAREEFRFSNGEATKSAAFTGRLPHDWRERFFERRNHIAYTVYSHATPIAWYDDEEGWTMPLVRYSVTTSKVQNKIRAALNSFAFVTTEL